MNTEKLLRELKRYVILEDGSSYSGKRKELRKGKSEWISFDELKAALAAPPGETPLSRPLSDTENMAARLGWIEGYVIKAVTDGEGGNYAHEQAMKLAKTRFDGLPTRPAPSTTPAEEAEAMVRATEAIRNPAPADGALLRDVLTAELRRWWELGEIGANDRYDDEADRILALAVPTAPSAGVRCPFCKEGDFDLIGLRHHLMVGDCKTFDETLTVDQERERRAALQAPDSEKELHCE